MTIAAQDHGLPPNYGFTTVTVRVNDVNDKPPRFSKKSYEFKVFENASIGTEIGQVLATDDDLNSQLIYSIVSFNDVKDENGLYVNESR